MKSNSITENRTAEASAENKPKKAKKQRAWELDALRGLAILLVAWDHLMFDIAYMYGGLWRMSGTEGMRDAVTFAREYQNGELRYIFWPVFVYLFFIVSGICTTFSRNNILRGLKLAAVALGLTGATILLEKVFEMDEVQIIFGVLHCMATCILLYAVFELFGKLLTKITKKPNVTKWVLAAFCIAVGITVLVLDSIYNTPVMEVTTLNSIPSSDVKILGLFIYIREWWAISADYFPLLPFLGYFMLGAGIATVIYPKKKSLLPKLDGKWNYVLTIPGRYSIFVYLGSQVLAVGILAFISYITTGVLF